jgi:hypothetical protein
MGKKRVLVGYGGKYDYWLSPQCPNQLIHNSRCGRCIRLVCLLIFSKSSNYLQYIRINTQDGSPQNGTNVSRGIFGATVGIDRLLKLFDKHDIKATFLSVPYIILYLKHKSIADIYHHKAHQLTQSNPFQSK